jgi:hypothetical protein
MASRPSGWAVGWALFAAVMLLVVGVFQALAGLVGIIEDDFIVVGPEYTYEFSVTAWGWAHLILGIVLVLAGLGIFTGNVLARTVGVVLAALSAIANFAWLPYQPVWSVVMIAVAVAVIWALTVHGRDVTEY